MHDGGVLIWRALDGWEKCLPLFLHFSFTPFSPLFPFFLVWFVSGDIIHPNEQYTLWVGMLGCFS